MSDYRARRGFVHGQAERSGILLCNLGTPASPETADVRRYLAEFLSDPRVVELPRWLWLPILHGVILNVRPRRSAHAYRKIWTAEGSPLLTGTLELGRRVEHALVADSDAGDHLRVAVAMRYGEPAIASVLDALLADNVRRILVVPLYPQYAAATTASVHDAVYAACSRMRWTPELRVVGDYHDDPAYIAALADSVRSFRTQHGSGERLLMSFHGIPHDTFLAGDPYFCQCQATARLLAAELGLGDNEWAVTFQSRVGPKQWLEPYTDKTLLEWGAAGVGDIDVICPGFAVDCLETLEEIAIANAAAFRAASGGALRYIPALNDSPAHVDVLGALIARHLGDWYHQPRRSAADQGAAAERAGKMGASSEPL